MEDRYFLNGISSSSSGGRYIMFGNICYYNNKQYKGTEIADYTNYYIKDGIWQPEFTGEIQDRYGHNVYVCNGLAFIGILNNYFYKQGKKSNGFYANKYYDSYDGIITKKCEYLSINLYDSIGCFTDYSKIKLGEGVFYFDNGVLKQGIDKYNNTYLNGQIIYNTNNFQYIYFDENSCDCTLYNVPSAEDCILAFSIIPDFNQISSVTITFNNDYNDIGYYYNGIEDINDLTALNKAGVYISELSENSITIYGENCSYCFIGFAYLNTEKVNEPLNFTVTCQALDGSDSGSEDGSDDGSSYEGDEPVQPVVTAEDWWE